MWRRRAGVDGEDDFGDVADRLWESYERIGCRDHRRLNTYGARSDCRGLYTTDGNNVAAGRRLLRAAAMAFSVLCEVAKAQCGRGGGKKHCHHGDHEPGLSSTLHVHTLQ